MKIKLFLPLILLASFNVLCNAQNKLTIDLNLLRDDSLLKRSIKYFNPGESGINQLWDFSDLQQSHEKQLVLYQKDSVGRITAEENYQLDRYRLKSDTLVQFDGESPLKTIRYLKPIVKMKYPFNYGDSISSGFLGYGLYCGDHAYKEKGISMVMGDAYGSIILSKNDTLRNVLRVYSLKSYSICMDIYPFALDTAKLKQVIEERYEWYARGYRYPIFETITNTSYSDMSPIGTTQTAYCYLPDDQFLLNDSINKDVLEKDSIARVKEEFANKDIIHYDVTVNGSTINIQYNLDADARIVTLISSSMGIIFERKEWLQQAGQGYSSSINCSGLIRGQYILYINVNGKIYNEKVNL